MNGGDEDSGGCRSRNIETPGDGVGVVGLYSDPLGVTFGSLVDRRFPPPGGRGYSPRGQALHLQWVQDQRDQCW